METHIETFGRTRPVEVHTINVDGFDRPTFAVPNNEIVRQLIAENIEFQLKILRRRGIGPQVVILVVEDCPRKIRRHEDRNRSHTRDSCRLAGDCWIVRRARSLIGGGFVAGLSERTREQWDSDKR